MDESNVDIYKGTVGKSLRALGFKVFYEKKDTLAASECCLHYTNVQLELYTTHDYVQINTLAIDWFERVDSNLPVKVGLIVSNVEKDVIQSGIMNSTTYKFGESKITDLGTSYRARLLFSFREIVDHG